MQAIAQNVSILALLGLGGGEILLILALTMALFGARQLPHLAQEIQPRMFLRLLKAVTDALKGIDRGASDAGRSLGGIYGKPAAQVLTPDNQVAELYNPAVFQKKSTAARRSSKRKFVLVVIALSAAAIAIIMVVFR